ncbi:hypothetical protein LIER_26532 [Lithospermum erythrorhizon]|uniref:Uncharacterized protein n=1 Tax=Lithospermum erythrorhizon TaxID=34254 RepID=A0AAV3RC34_LITER
MSGKRIHLFNRAKVLKKSSQESALLSTTSPVSTTPEARPAVLGKRPLTLDAPPRPLFSKWMKSIAHKFPNTHILDLTAEEPETAPSKENVSLESLPEESSSCSIEKSNSAPKAKTCYSTNYLDLPYTLPGGFKVTADSTLWKKSNAFYTTSPLLLEHLGKDLEELPDPMEIHGSIMKYLIKSMNASYVISRRADRLDDTCDEGRERERALNLKIQHDTLIESVTKLEGDNFDLSSKVKRLQLCLDRATKRANEAEEKAMVAQETDDAVTAQRISEGIEAFKGSDEYALEVGKDAAYCLCRFEKSYKDVCPAIVDYFQDLIQHYPEDWFSHVDVRAPLSPADGKDAAYCLCRMLMCFENLICFCLLT